MHAAAGRRNPSLAVVVHVWRLRNGLPPLFPVTLSPAVAWIRMYAYCASRECRAGAHRCRHPSILPSPASSADSLTEEQQEMVDSAAELLYGLIHARYIITSRGLNAMVRANWRLEYAPLRPPHTGGDGK